MAAYILALMFHVCEHIFVNPCSYESCYQVLHEIGKKTGIKSMVMETENGSPYVVIVHLMLCACALSCQHILATNVVYLNTA